MNKGFLTRTWTLLTAMMVLSVGLNAGVIISGNFCSTAPVANPGDGGLEGEAVGLHTGANQWFNDLTEPFGYTLPDSGPADTGSESVGAAAAATPGSAGANLFSQSQVGLPAGLTIDWNAGGYDDHDERGGAYTVDSRHDQLFGGFLYSQQGGTITLQGSGLTSVYGTDPYSLYLYVDGENGLGNSPNNVHTWYARDDDSGLTYYGNDETDFLGDPTNTYTQVTSTTAGTFTNGNYVVFNFAGGDDDFNITLSGADPTLYDGNGIVLNGFEIVPEPSSFALLALLGCAGGLIRRRRSA